MNLWLYLIVVNLLTFAMYWQDKRAAKQRGAARVPEAMLLMVGLAGGTPTALIAQKLLRHKTKKQSFQFKFWAITLVQIALLLFPPDVLKLIASRAFN